MGQRIVVVGGSAAGPKAAAKARRMNPEADIIIVQKAKYLSMASCGYPYYVAGVFDDRNKLISTGTGTVRDPKYFLQTKGIEARVETEAVSIDRQKKILHCRNLVNGESYELPYDQLILTTGATPVRPPVPGIDLKGITTLQSMEDADYLRSVRDSGKVKKAVVIGGGLIGLESCEALHQGGLELTVIERLPQVLSFLDWELSALVEQHLCCKGVNVITNNGLAAFLGQDGKLTGVKLANGTELPCELAVIAIGVRPNSTLAKAAGLEIGVTGGIKVDEHMRTSDPSILASGDCIEIKNVISGKAVSAPFGDLANLQGRIAGRNTTLQTLDSCPGTIQTGICKIFDYNAGCTGLSEKAAREAGFDCVCVINASSDKPDFMNGKLLVSKVVAERSTGRILGAQCVGPGDVSKQIAIWATALLGKLTINQMSCADLPYAPPFSLAVDHSVAGAHLLQNKLEGRLKGISSMEVKKLLDAGEKLYLLDVRGPNEYAEMRLGLGETLIPQYELRQRFDDLPADKDTPIVCYCKVSLRGYEAALTLEAHGWRNVRVMEGGIIAWPYPRAK